MTFISTPHCDACGLPFEYEVGEDALCAACSAEAPAYRRARTAIRYGDIAASLITRLKHLDQTHLAPSLAEWMARAGAGLIADAELITAVPLHRRRLWQRRFNQSVLLAQKLGRLSDREVVPDLLTRRRPTRPQVGLTRSERQRNVSGAFTVPQRHAARIEGATILLIDDVFTTGATISACARVLYAAGAAHVDVLTVARVISTD